jgi:peptide/nickel transport system ATP-binding protein
VSEPVLRVADLRCGFNTEEGYLRVVDGISFDLQAGSTLGLVGESGCGKTVSALAIMGLLPKPAGVLEGGQILYNGEDLAAADHAAMRRVRGRDIGMIFQEPMTALNPVHRIGKQLVEALALYEPGQCEAALAAKAIGLLDQVGISAAEQRLREYPHQLSGGMRQRVMIAMALAGRPKVLIADEPSTALDVTVQAQILDLLRALQAEHGMAIIFITHDLGVVAELCDHVIVMYAGRVAERASVRDLFKHPRHPYTHGLIGSIPTPTMPSKSLLPVIEGVVPKLTDMPAGCRFSNRCQFADEHCRADQPALETIAAGHDVACHHWEKLVA